MENLKLYVNVKDLSDSMLLDSDMLVAKLETEKGYITLKTKGYVDVRWSESGRFSTSDTHLHKPSQFPKELKDLIRGNVAQKLDPDSDGINIWENDVRVWVKNRNWFNLQCKTKYGVIFIRDFFEIQANNEEELIKFIYEKINEIECEE